MDGELRVAVGRSDGRAVADPFHLTADLVKLVSAQAAESARAAPVSHRWLARLAPAARREARA